MTLLTLPISYPCYAVYTKLGDICFYPKVTIPDLKYFVDLDAKGDVMIYQLAEHLRRSDGKEITSKEQEIFATGILAWMLSISKDGSYILDRNDEGRLFLSHPSGIKLTRDEFQALRDDKTHGLVEFMELRFDLVCKQLSKEPEPFGHKP